MSSCWTDTVWGEDRTDGNKYGPEYYSARGENCPPRYDETLKEYLSNGEEYSYIFTSAGWVCYDMNEFNDNDPEIVEIPSGALSMIEAPLIVDLEELEVLQTALQKLSKSDSKSPKVSLLYNKIVSIKETIELQELYLTDPRND